MRLIRSISALTLLLMFSGCALMRPVNEMSDFMKTTFNPRGLDYRMASDNATGKHKQTAMEARGDRPKDKLNDPFDGLFDSPVAREITENVGYEY